MLPRSNIHLKCCDALSRLSDASGAQADPAEYARAYGDFATAAAEMATENMAAFAEIARKLQQDTVAMLMAAGKSAAEDGSAALGKTTEGMTAAARKATDRWQPVGLGVAGT